MSCFDNFFFNYLRKSSITQRVLEKHKNKSKMCYQFKQAGMWIDLLDHIFYLSRATFKQAVPLIRAYVEEILNSKRLAWRRA